MEDRVMHTSSCDDQKQLERLVAQKKEYDEEVRILEESMNGKEGCKGGAAPEVQVTTEEVKQLIEQLKRLKHCGKAIRDCLSSHKDTTAIRYEERAAPPVKTTNPKVGRLARVKKQAAQAVDAGYNFFFGA